MKKLLLAFTATLLVFSNSYAQDIERSVLAKQLAEVLGFETMMAGLRNQTQLSADQQVSQMMGQFKKSFPNIPPQFMKELGEAGAVFVQKTSTAWDTAEAARIYSGALADVLPENELRASIEHYRSSEGQLQLKAISEAAAKLNAYVLSSIQQASQAGTQEFISKLKLIVEKARRDREATKDNQPEAPAPDRETAPGQ